MRKLCFLLCCCFLLGSTLAACRRQSSPNRLKTPLLLWHSWNEEDTQVLTRALNNFSSIYPDITVVQQSLPPEQLLERFKARAASGLGPDLLLLPMKIPQELIDEGLLREVSLPEKELSIYFSAALDTLRYHDTLYALPLSLHTHALYYNAALVEKPPANLEELLQEALNGRRIALDINFYDAFWGIQAFGGTLFDPEGRVALNRGGFTNWLNWLKAARNVPSMLLSNDSEMLRNAFLQGETAYYTGSSRELPVLQKTLGEPILRVVPLPAGPNDLSGPVLEIEALLFNSASSPKQTEAALQLAQFLTNFEQQTEFVRKLGRIPSNSGIWVDPKIYPAVAKFVEQTRSAVVLPNIPQVADVHAGGDDAYRHTLSGVSDARDAAEQLARLVNTKYGFQTDAPLVKTAQCELEGEVRVWFLPFENDASALEEIRRRFADRCPKIAVELVPLEADDDDTAYQRYTEAAEEGNAPELFLASNHLTAMLAAEGQIGELNDLLKPEFLQRYIPEVKRAMSYDGRLYALPVSINELMALYYNADLVEDPPLVLNDLLNQASPERAILLPVDFYHGYWGLPAFGATVFDRDYRVVLDSSGMAEWLQWLKEAEERPGISVYPLKTEEDFNYVKQQFSEGHVAYFAGEAEFLNEFQAALGEEKVRVVPLPAGPNGQSGPILGVSGAMLSAGISESALEPALAFARFLTENESQAILMEQGKQIPANINVDTGAYPAIAGFLQQARTASVPPIVPQIESVFLWGDDAYYNTIDGQFSPEAAVEHLAALANKMNGLTATETETPQECGESGTVRFWHTWSEEKSAVLEQLSARFTELCPELTLDVKFVAAEKLQEELLQASATNKAPDIMLAPHTQLADLRREQAVKDILPFIPRKLLLPYRSNALSQTIRQGGKLYGLPLTCDVAGLFYRTDRLEEAPGWLEELASPEHPLALNLNFAETFWGITAFQGWAFETDDDLPLEQEGFTGWLQWLKDAHARGAVLASADEKALMQSFQKGKAAGLIARAGKLSQLRKTMGENTIGVSLLPAGPEGHAGGSFLFLDTFAFPMAVPEERTRRALSFAEFAVSDGAQTILMNEAGLLPVNNLTRVTISDPALASLDEIVEYLSVEWDASPQMQRLQRNGTQLYIDLLSGKVSVNEALPLLREQIQGE